MIKNLSDKSLLEAKRERNSVSDEIKLPAMGREELASKLTWEADSSGLISRAKVDDAISMMQGKGGRGCSFICPRTKKRP